MERLYWNWIADDLAWVTGQLHGIIIVSVHWDFMWNMRMWWWAAVFDFNCCSLSSPKHHEDTGENEKMTWGMGDENDAAERTLVTDAALSEGLAQTYDLQWSVSLSRESSPELYNSPYFSRYWEQKRHTFPSINAWRIAKHFSEQQNL